MAGPTLTTNQGINEMERGQEFNGGKFVGQAKRGSVWVWYPGCDRSFDEMCQQFDRLYK